MPEKCVPKKSLGLHNQSSMMTLTVHLMSCRAVMLVICMHFSCNTQAYVTGDQIFQCKCHLQKCTHFFNGREPFLKRATHVKYYT